MRRAVLALCRAHGIPCEVRDIPEVEIHRSDEIFCTGTMGEIAAVKRIDDTVFGDGRPGTVTSRLSDLYSRTTSTEGTLVV